MPPARKKGSNKRKVNSQLNLGDLVLAKVKGFPYWPAKISRPEDWDHSPDPRKYFVQFYGTKEIAFVAPTEIQQFTIEVKNKLSAKCDQKSVRPFAQAAREICEAFEQLDEKGLNEVNDDSTESVSINKHSSIEVSHNKKTEPCLDEVSSTDREVVEFLADVPKCIASQNRADIEIEEFLVDAPKSVEGLYCISGENNLKSKNFKPTVTGCEDINSHSMFAEKRNTATDGSVHPSNIVVFASSHISSSKNVSNGQDEKSINCCRSAKVTEKKRNDNYGPQRYLKEELERPGRQKKKKLLKHEADSCVADDSLPTDHIQVNGVICEKKVQGCTEHDDATGIGGTSASITKSKNSYSMDAATDTSYSKEKKRSTDNFSGVQQPVLSETNAHVQASKTHGDTAEFDNANNGSLLLLTKRQRRTSDAISDCLFASGNKAGKRRMSSDGKKNAAKLLWAKRRAVYLDEGNTSELKTPEYGGSSGRHYVTSSICNGITNADITGDNSSSRLPETEDMVTEDVTLSEECKLSFSSLGGTFTANLHNGIESPAKVNEAVASCSPEKLEQEKSVSKDCGPSLTPFDGSGCSFHKDVVSPRRSREAMTSLSPIKSEQPKSISKSASPPFFPPKIVFNDVEEITVKQLEECKPSITFPGGSYSLNLDQIAEGRPKEICEVDAPPSREKMEREKSFSNQTRLPLMSPKKHSKTSKRSLIRQSNAGKSSPEVSQSSAQGKVTSGLSKNSAMPSQSSVKQAKIRSTKSNTNAVKSKLELKAKAPGFVKSPVQNIPLLNRRVEDDRLIPSICSTSGDSPMSMKHLIAAAQAKRRQNQSKDFASTDSHTVFSTPGDDLCRISPNSAVQTFVERNSNITFGDVDDPTSSSPIHYRHAFMHNQFDIEVNTERHQFDIEANTERHNSGQNDASVSLTGGTEASVARDAFEGMIETLSRTKDSIGRATRLAIDCAKYGIASEVVDLLVHKLESEDSLYRRVDLFFLVDSITQCSHSQKGIALASYIPIIQVALPRLLTAAAPSVSARENRRQCLKVLRLWLERKIFPEYLLRRYIDDLGISNADMTCGAYVKRLSRTERAVDDPIREMEGILVDEYGSNATFQFPGLLSSRFSVEDDDVLPRKSAESKLATVPFDIGELREMPEPVSNDRRHCVLKDVDGELEMEDVSAQTKEMKLVLSSDHLPLEADKDVPTLASDLQVQAGGLPLPECSPPLPPESPPLTPPLPLSPPPPSSTTTPALPPPPPPPQHISQVPMFLSTPSFPYQQSPLPSQPITSQIFPPPQLHPFASQPALHPNQATLFASHLPLRLPQPPPPPQPAISVPECQSQSQYPPIVPSSSLPPLSAQPPSLPPILLSQYQRPGLNEYCSTHSQPACFMPNGAQLRESSTYGSSGEPQYGSVDVSVASQSYRPNTHLDAGNAQRQMHLAPARLGHCSRLSYPNPNGLQHVREPCNQACSIAQCASEDQRRLSSTGLSVDGQRVKWTSGGNMPSGPSYVQDGYFTNVERCNSNLSFQPMFTVNLNPGYPGLQMFPSRSDTSTINVCRPA